MLKKITILGYTNQPIYYNDKKNDSPRVHENSRFSHFTRVIMLYNPICELNF